MVFEGVPYSFCRIGWWSRCAIPSQQNGLQ